MLTTWPALRGPGPYCSPGPTIGPIRRYFINHLSCLQAGLHLWEAGCAQKIVAGELCGTERVLSVACMGLALGS
jgi:hypothetical protein